MLFSLQLWPFFSWCQICQEELDRNLTTTPARCFITGDGYLISNYHVVKDATKVRLLTGAGLIDAKVVQVDAANDLALLKANAEGRMKNEETFKPLPIAASRTGLLGGTVATVGFPDIGFNAKAQSGKDARQTLFILCALAPLRLCVDFIS
jgi:S1-C subfamily serine protease